MITKYQQRDHRSVSIHLGTDYIKLPELAFTESAPWSSASESSFVLSVYQEFNHQACALEADRFVQIYATP